MGDWTISGQKTIAKYVFILQVLFLSFSGFLLLYNIGNTAATGSYFQQQMIFVGIVLLAYFFYVFSYQKNTEKNRLLYFTAANALYFVLVVSYLFSGPESVFKFLLLIPVIASALLYRAPVAFLWALMATVGLGEIGWVRGFVELPVDIFMGATFWLFAVVFSRLVTVSPAAEQGESGAAVSAKAPLGSSFYYYLHKYFLEAKEKKGKLVLMLLKVEFFKYYRDAYGYEKGNAVLKKVFEIMVRLVGGTGVCVHRGNNEFAIFLPDYNGARGLRLGEKIGQRLEETQIEGMGIFPGGHLTISVGVACFPEQAATEEELLQRADESLGQRQYMNSSGIELYFSVLDKIGHSLQGGEKNLLNSLRTLLMVVNAKDKYTYGHSERVMHYAMQTARRLTLWEWEIQDLAVGALLHDIGKIEISREILNKPIRLSDEEWNVIKNHCTWGADIIRPISLLQPVVDIVLQHHENLDGSGYPHALSGEKIALGARILRVVDSFDAMTTNRPYKKVKTFEEALTELEKCKGVFYDPEVVDAFLAYIQETGIVGAK